MILWRSCFSALVVLLVSNLAPPYAYPMDPSFRHSHTESGTWDAIIGTNSTPQRHPMEMITVSTKYTVYWRNKNNKCKKQYLWAPGLHFPSENCPCIFEGLGRIILNPNPNLGPQIKVSSWRSSNQYRGGWYRAHTYSTIETLDALPTWLPKRLSLESFYITQKTQRIFDFQLQEFSNVCPPHRPFVSELSLFSGISRYGHCSSLLKKMVAERDLVPPGRQDPNSLQCLQLPTPSL